MSPANDLDLYEREAHAWWDPHSHAFRSLHAVNALRRELFAEWFGPRMDGRTVVDLGCGGGLLAAWFADAGARVAGIDLSPGSARAASDHVAGLYARGDAERAPFGDACADVVVLADVLEHVPRPAAVLAEAARVLRPGGACFVSTLNRTRRARVLGVWLAEGLGLVPRGTHDARMFVTPDELARWAGACGLTVETLQGESLDVARTLRRWTVVLRRGTSTAITYSALLRRR